MLALLVLLQVAAACDAASAATSTRSAATTRRRGWPASTTGRVTIAAYAISGLCAGVAALLLVARLTTSTEALGTGMELTAIAAAVIGGVSLAGGVGCVVRAGASARSCSASC